MSVSSLKPSMPTQVEENCRALFGCSGGARTVGTVHVPATLVYCPYEPVTAYPDQFRDTHAEFGTEACDPVGPGIGIRGAWLSENAEAAWETDPSPQDPIAVTRISKERRPNLLAAVRLMSPPSSQFSVTRLVENPAMLTPMALVGESAQAGTAVLGPSESVDDQPSGP
jgi:hypothetical protein